MNSTVSRNASASRRRALVGSPAAAGRRRRGPPAPATSAGRPDDGDAALDRRGRHRLRQPDLRRIDLQPARQPGPELATNRLRRARQPVHRDRPAIVVQVQDRRLLDEHPRDVVEPQVRAPQHAAGPAQVEPVERPALPQQVPEVAAPQVGQRQVAQELDRRLGVAPVQRRAIQVVLVEQPDVPQEGQLAVLEEHPAGTCGAIVVSRALRDRDPIVRGTEEQLRVDDPLGQELGVLVAARDFRLLVWAATAPRRSVR